MIRVEEKIRDKLALKLSLLEENLTLLNKEEYLPNKQGTRGFVDILAEDSQNRYVIIELKRSKSASREALHEILKYIEGIKENKSLKDDEIIAYIVSTEWDELLIPFSSFVSQVPYTVIGYKLEIDENLNPILANRVTPLKLENERLFSDKHDFSYYSTKEKLKEGIKSHQENLKIKDIDDYVLVILKNDDYIHESYLSGKKSIYNYIIYCAVQVQNNQKCLNIIYKNDKDYYKEVIEFYGTDKIEDLEDKSLLSDVLYNCKPFPFAESVEISYPAKLKHRLLEKEEWKIVKIIRGKKLKENRLLTDETILDELQGSVGTNKQIYNKNFTSSNSASLKQLLKEIEVCLTDNEIWLSGVKKALLEVEKINTSLEGNLNIYNPSNTLYSMYRFYKADYNIDEYGNVNFLKNFPNYTFEVKGQEVEILFFGCLDYFDSDITLDEVIDTMYNGNKSNLLTTQSWGGYQKNDIDIVSLYGLEYSNYMVKKLNNEYNFFKFDGFRYKACERVAINKGIADFYANRRDFIMEVCALFEEAEIGDGFFET